jgi:hypothetical protein
LIEQVAALSNRVKNAESNGICSKVPCKVLRQVDIDHFGNDDFNAAEAQLEDANIVKALSEKTP